MTPCSIRMDSSALTRAAISSSERCAALGTGRGVCGDSVVDIGVLLSGWRGGSGQVEVGLPDVERDRRVGVPVLAPQVGGAEDDGVHVLRVVAPSVAGAVGVDEGAVRGLDD